MTKMSDVDAAADRATGNVVQMRPAAAQPRASTSSIQTYTGPRPAWSKKLESAGKDLDAHSRAHGYESHAEHLKLLSPRKGKDKNIYRPTPTSEW